MGRSRTTQIATTRKRAPRKCKPAATPAPPPSPDPAHVEQVLRWMIAGHRDADVLQSIAEHWPGQDLELLLQAVADHLNADGAMSRQRVIGWCYNATKEIYRRSLEIGDLAGGLRAVRVMAALAEKHGIDDSQPQEGGADVRSPC
jgi:hypothetical protein